MNPLPSRFTYTVTPTGCWEWAKFVHPNGYGMAWWNGRMWFAHIAAYRIAVGPVPAGLELDHLCRNRRCMNPSHLEAVTRATNILRTMPFWKKPSTPTHCRNGHERTPENTYLRADGKVRCRPCTIAHNNASLERHWDRRLDYVREYRRRKRAVA